MNLRIFMGGNMEGARRGRDWDRDYVSVILMYEIAKK